MSQRKPRAPNMILGRRIAAAAALGTFVVILSSAEIAEHGDDGFYIPAYNRRGSPGNMPVVSPPGSGASPQYEYPTAERVNNNPGSNFGGGIDRNNYAERAPRNYNPTYNGGGGQPNYQRPSYSPVVLPLVDVTRYWKLWGLQHSLCDTVSNTLEENNIKELTSQQATQIGRALERSNQVYADYHRNMVPDLMNDRDPMAVEARLWLGHDQFERDLYDCWSNLSFISPSTQTDLSTHLFESVHDSLARSLCLPFDNYMACRELLQLPKNSIRRFKEQLKIMKDEASMLLRRMGRPTSYTYYRNQFYYGGADAPSWADSSSSPATSMSRGRALLIWVVMISLIIASS